MDLDEKYLDEQFPKGDKRRGEAMVLLALARQNKDSNKRFDSNNKLEIIFTVLIWLGIFLCSYLLGTLFRGFF